MSSLFRRISESARRRSSRRRYAVTAYLLALFGTTLSASAVVVAETYRLPLFVNQTVSGQTGVLRIDNQSDLPGSVFIYAIDDAGTRSGPATFGLAAGTAVEFEATELESGSEDKGLTGGLGDLRGSVRLEIVTELSVRPLAYLRTAEGARSVLHDQVRARTNGRDGGYTFWVPVFNPAHNITQESQLRLINPSGESAMVMIEGFEDTGAAALGGAVSLMLPAGSARTLTAQHLEAGDSELVGQFGAGAGRWRLLVSSDQTIEVVNLIRSSTGRLDNLSSIGEVGLAPIDSTGFGERFAESTIVTRSQNLQTRIGILPGGEFRETAESTEAGALSTRSGTFKYKRTSLDTLQLMLAYLDGDRCLAHFHFSSSTGGWFASRCDGADEGEAVLRGGSWVVADEEDPPAPPTPPNEGISWLRFPDTSHPGDLSFAQGMAISAITLPVATGGEGTLSYSFAPLVPGLMFEATTRQLTGAPTQVGVQAVTYTVTDGEGNIDSLRFLIIVREAGSIDCLLGLLLGPGESCTYPGTSEAFSVNPDGTGSFLIITSGRAINLPNRAYQGQVYDFRASHQGNSLWRIDRLRSVEAPRQNTAPRFRNADRPDDQSYLTGMAADALTLPPASGGEGSLVYRLSPNVPGLGFDAATRQLGGVPTQAGTYELMYSVTDEDGDTDSLLFTITVEEPPKIPDLIVESVSVDDSTLNIGQSFTLSATVRNQGTGQSTSTILRYYRSSDMTISASDTQVGMDTIASLAITGTSDQSISLTALPAEGIYYYGVCVESITGEGDTTNNCSIALQVTVVKVPDLIVESPSVSDGSLRPSQHFTLSARVRNQGTTQSTGTTLRYYRSSDTRISTTDTEVGSERVGELNAQEVNLASILLTAPSTAGDYFYGACVDSVDDELDTDNNCSSWVKLTVRRRTSSRTNTTSPGFDIDVVYVDPQPSASVRAAISRAEAVWERAITNDLPDQDFAGNPVDNPCTDGEFDGYVDDVRVYIHYRHIDGSGGTTASAGMCILRSASEATVIGRIVLDSSDVGRLSTSTVEEVALHELAHVFGFGLRWDNLQNPSFQGGQPVDPPPDTHWPGPNAVAAFNAAGGSGYQGGKVPVENEHGGPGSQDRHWRQSAMPGELMTYNLNGGALSRVTIESMIDLGYSVNTSVADAYRVPSVVTDISPLSTVRTLPLECRIEQFEVEIVPEFGHPRSR